MADYRTPSPDAGHEAIRAPLAQAIDDLRDTIDGQDIAFSLVDTLFLMVDAQAAQLAELVQWKADAAAATGDTLTVTEVDGGWTWTRLDAQGRELAHGDVYSRKGDAWRGAHRSNPDL